jgi:1-acyl-sn-glycerol-3-phosphate acyltransferase
VHVHLLDPIPTAGLTYDDRNALADQVRERMAECLRTHYGVEPAMIERDVVPSTKTRVPATSSS